MVASNQVQRESSGASSQTATPAAKGRTSTVPSLRGQSYDVQQKALSPDAQPGFVQQEAKLKPDDAAPVAPVGAPPVAPGAPEGAAKAPDTDGPLTDQEVAQAMQIARGNPIPFDAMATYQKMNGLDPSGVLDRATVQKTATIRLAPAPVEAEAATPDAGAPKKKKPAAKKKQPSKTHLGVPDAAFLKTQGIDVVVIKEKFAAAGKSSNAAAPLQDFACQAIEKMTYNQYIGTLCNGTFLGFDVVLHKDMLNRLKAAERFLASKFAADVSSDPKQLRARLGVTSVSHFRLSSEKSDQMNHGFGFAIDLNPGTNPWVFGNTGRSTQNAAFPIVLERAAAFVGQGVSLTASKISKMAGKMTTSELIGQLGMADKSLEDYRKFAKLEKTALNEVVKKRLAESPAVAKLGDEKFWMTKIPFDDVIMGKYIEAQASDKEKPTHTGGFMDLQPIVIEAMRDVAGLRWGATDMGAESGDMMHFDGMNTISKCTSLNGAMREARKKLIPEAPKGDDKTKA